jgi:phosphoribosylpyrophosphate synthetase
VCLDLHAAQIQGFFDIPCDNLNAMPFFVKYIKECIPDYEKAVILAKNAGGAKRSVKCCTGQGAGSCIIGPCSTAASPRVDVSQSCRV